MYKCRIDTKSFKSENLICIKLQDNDTKSSK